MQFQFQLIVREKLFIIFISKISNQIIWFKFNFIFLSFNILKVRLNFILNVVTHFPAVRIGQSVFLIWFRNYFFVSQFHFFHFEVCHAKTAIYKNMDHKFFFSLLVYLLLFFRIDYLFLLVFLFHLLFDFLIHL